METNVPLHPARHILLYAKNAYRKTPGNPLPDIKVLLGDFIGVEPSQVTDEQAIRLLWEICSEFIPPDPNKLNFEVSGLLIAALQSGNAINNILNGMLNILQSLQIRKAGHLIINLGDPDARLLPLNK
jgi:hypothetical protein